MHTIRLYFITIISLVFGSNLQAQVEYGIEISTGYSHSVFPEVTDGEVDVTQTPTAFEFRKIRFYGASIGTKFIAAIPSRNLEIGIQTFYMRSYHPSFDQVSVNSSSRISFDLHHVTVGPNVGCYVGEAKRLRLSAGLPISLLAYFNRDSKDIAGTNFESSRLHKGRVSVGISSAVDYTIYSKNRSKLFVGIQFLGDTSYPKSLLIKRSAFPEDVFIEFEKVGQLVSPSESGADFGIVLHRLQFNLKYLFQMK